jgi:hypothetical protein
MPPLPSPLFLYLLYTILSWSVPTLHPFSFFYFLYRGRIRGRTGRFYERGVYVSMWVFVTLHLNPHHSFGCFFGLFIVRTLPFSCSSFLQRPTPDYPQLSRTRRLMKTGAATTHSNSLAMKCTAFFVPWRWDHYVSQNFRYQSPSNAPRHARTMEFSTAPRLKPKNSQDEFIYHLN